MLGRPKCDKEIADALVVDRNLTKRIYSSFMTMAGVITFDPVFLHFLFISCFILIRNMPRIVYIFICKNSLKLKILNVWNEDVCLNKNILDC